LAEIPQTAHVLPPGHVVLERLGLSSQAEARILVSPVLPSAIEMGLV